MDPHLNFKCYAYVILNLRLFKYCYGDKNICFDRFKQFKNGETSHLEFSNMRVESVLCAAVMYRINSLP